MTMDEINHEVTHYSTPLEVETDAKHRFEQSALAATGQKWDWTKTSCEIRNRWRIKALVAELIRTKTLKLKSEN